ncbi:MAG: FtsW/RodA/SpoVE family cell cycle protein [Peptostreptococcaceae bacterium]|nr:FtsW/RodA/SpoVE family cell cycle protein [Peptostreptococcaceae bacterium]
MLNIIQSYSISMLYTTGVRWVLVLLAGYILIKSIRSLLSTRATPEVWAYLHIENGDSLPITHWENVIGRSSSVDLRIKDKSVSRNHSLLIRNKDGTWIYEDLGSTNGSSINDEEANEREKMLCEIGDEIKMGSVSCTLFPISLEEQKNNKQMREMDKEPVSPWKIIVALSFFQILTVIQLIIGLGDRYIPMVSVSFFILMLIMWFYVFGFRALGSRGFELEIMAFFLSTISLAIVASSAPEMVFKQLIAIGIGIVLFVFMCIFLRNLKRAKFIRPMLIILSVAILVVNLVFGTLKYGAVNWLEIGGISFQPSEIVKLAFIWIGAATLDELYQKRNLTIFMVFSGFCLASLAIMGDFGTASIYFVTFLLISFLRSGDVSRMALTIGGAILLGIMVIRFKPYIADRFSAWGHVWEFADSLGYQQTRTMTASANGGLAGLGAGNGMLRHVAAANTDLVFGMVVEEWGIIIAALMVLCIIALLLFTSNSILAGRSTFYSIAACGATTMLIFQTMLNVFGALDFFPLTGVTFPFVSHGGTSMAVSWGMLSFLKAADMRKNASLAINNRVKNIIVDKDISEEDEVGLDA